MKYTVIIGPFICDAPARAFIKSFKCIKGYRPTGYFGCERCFQEGYYVAHRLTFPDTSARKRTDDGFRRMEDDDHHLAESPLAGIGISMVSGFPLDYMYLICLGVVRKMVKSWLSGGPISVRLSTRQSDELSLRLENLRSCIPSEFHRRPRGLREIDRWKATEWRQLILYTGPVVLKGIVSEVVYKHFLILHVAVYCLTTCQLSLSHCDYGNELLKQFVEEFAEIYGEQSLEYNIHNLCHVEDDCKNYGALDNISAFPFEN